MESYDLKEIMSGDDENSLWVSLGFSSEMAELDVVYIVCGKSINEQDCNTDMDGIYLERYDQAYSGYKGADTIQVSDFLIQVDLNSKGQKDLDFQGTVSFRIPTELKGLSNAVDIFKKMSQYECGQIIKVTKD